MAESLSRKRGVVTAEARGIGRAAAEAFAETGIAARLKGTCTTRRIHAMDGGWTA